MWKSEAKSTHPHLKKRKCWPGWYNLQSYTSTDYYNLMEQVLHMWGLAGKEECEWCVSSLSNLNSYQHITCWEYHLRGGVGDEWILVLQPVSYQPMHIPVPDDTEVQFVARNAQVDTGHDLFTREAHALAQVPEPLTNRIHTSGGLAWHGSLPRAPQRAPMQTEYWEPLP